MHIRSILTLGILAALCIAPAFADAPPGSGRNAPPGSGRNAPTGSRVLMNEEEPASETETVVEETTPETR